MHCFRVLAICAVALLTQILSAAADDVPSLQTAHGVIQRVEKDSLAIKRRAADGKFDTDLVLKLTGTSRFSSLSMQKRGEKVVPVQKDVDVKSLAEKQVIALIYTTHADEHVLLTAVVHTP